MNDWLEVIQARLPELILRTSEHIVLTGVSTLAATSIGVPLGVLASRQAGLRTAITGAVGILQTIPSLAMLALLLTLTGRIGAVPALLALSFYALLPIVRNTLTGLITLPPETLEAADGIGMTRRQRLWIVELPLAAPVILTGIRTAAVVGVGIATLSAFIGAGGLGQFINRGLSLSNNQLILLGAVPAAVLALVVDAALGALGWAVQRRGGRRGAQRLLTGAALALPLLIFALGLFGARPSESWRMAKPPGGVEPEVIRVGSKNFTEQLILGELMAQLIEGTTTLQVERRFDLGGTMICHGALVAGGIDLYAEYTGTALTAILGRPAATDPEAVFATVSTAYAEKFSAEWLPSFGFNNTYALAVRDADAASQRWQTISDLRPDAGRLRAGWTSEFGERSDGYPGLARHYGLEFGETRDLEVSLMFEAVTRGQVDVISAFATDGRLAAAGLRVLRDDRSYFPPYFAAPVVRRAVLERHPEVAAALLRLTGGIDTEEMQRLNFEVEHNRRRPVDVAREFLIEQQLLPPAASPVQP